jgi:hypothetical protein
MRVEPTPQAPNRNRIGSVAAAMLLALAGSIAASAIASMPQGGPGHATRGVSLPSALGAVDHGRGRPVEGTDSVARRWNDAMLDAIRRDTPRPTVHARNLFHVSAAMYDAWAAYDDRARAVFREESPPRLGNLAAARNEAISYAAYRMLSHRFAHSPGQGTSQADFDALMRTLGYPTAVTTVRGNSAAAVGNRIAAAIIARGLQDGANEAGGYAGGHAPINAPMTVASAGTGPLADPNRWQPLIVPGSQDAQAFLTPHWRGVAPFALRRSAGGAPYHDPGGYPRLGGVGDARVKAEVLELIRLSSQLDPSDGVEIDISPAVVGNSTFGSNDGSGHPRNPATGQPYPGNPVLRGDWGRVLAEFWADGPTSATPPGHWNEIANAVSDHPSLERRIGGSGALVPRLEWDVKLYLALNGAVHDAAIATWEAKQRYDSARPITLIRWMGGLGQSSDPGAASFHVDGLPLVPGLVEVVTAASSLPGARHAHLVGHEGAIAIRAWRGHPADAQTRIGGVGWILATRWLPYQQADFVTPPFPGYTSGHSGFSRASAEVLAAFTGSPFFPGGYGEYVVSSGAAGFGLRFEHGPSRDVRLQWATYADAADEAGLSRIHGGIHPSFDDLAGRRIGLEAGTDAMLKALALFDGSAD